MPAKRKNTMGVNKSKTCLRMVLEAGLMLYSRNGAWFLRSERLDASPQFEKQPFSG